MATKPTTKKTAPAKKTKSDAPASAKTPKGRRKPPGADEPPRLPLVKVSVTYRIADGTTAEFTIDGDKLREKDFAERLERFIAEASDSEIYVASNGEWKPANK